MILYVSVTPFILLVAVLVTETLCKSFVDVIVTVNPADIVSMLFNELSLVVTLKDPEVERERKFLIPGITAIISPVFFPAENNPVNLNCVLETAVQMLLSVPALILILHPETAAEVSVISMPDGKLIVTNPFATTLCCVVNPNVYVTPVLYAMKELGVTLNDVNAPVVIETKA